MRSILVVIFCLIASTTFAQKEGKPLVQFSGVIYDIDSNTVVPYVTLNNLSEKKTHSANYKGYYSFVAHEGDSIQFSSVGYKKLVLVIPQNLKERKFTAVVKMKSDNIILPTVRVFPWASYDEFKRDFLTMKFADDDLEIAKKNLSSKSLRDLYVSLPRDGTEMQSFNFQNNHIGLTNKNMVQTNPLLNPFAWGALIKQITEGNKERNKK
ncbi:peptidase associated/transthyretin-like domain-containing protein [Pedobacter puniceum]|jgi:hypothetical protein|uniref:Carboxypeptidase-like regulatory domain-containing protein n=1 Tax=Pedobacter puniceum TaxID=2666136 RepID=A0A7K0FRJ2_9SPHI|nr:hypothetical protein [Pedobacter puniceum]MRX47707.1 hypothetical protein [Pedobacter puniceum]